VHPHRFSGGVLDVYHLFCHTPRHDIVASDWYWYDFGLFGPVRTETDFLSSVADMPGRMMGVMF
jgi:hypothetical protein